MKGSLLFSIYINFAVALKKIKMCINNKYFVFKKAI